MLEHVMTGEYQPEIYKKEIGYGEYLLIGAFSIPPKNGDELHVNVPGPSKDSLPSLTGIVRLDGPLNYGMDLIIYNTQSDFFSMQMIQQGGLQSAKKTA